MLITAYWQTSPESDLDTQKAQALWKISLKTFMQRSPLIRWSRAKHIGICSPPWSHILLLPSAPVWAPTVCMHSHTWPHLLAGAKSIIPGWVPSLWSQREFRLLDEEIQIQDFSTHTSPYSTMLIIKLHSRGTLAARKTGCQRSEWVS